MKTKNKNRICNWDLYCLNCSGFYQKIYYILLIFTSKTYSLNEKIIAFILYCKYKLNYVFRNKYKKV